jgi:ABC-2 type transport system permease protein
VSASTVVPERSSDREDESAAGQPVTFVRVLNSEWVKFRSLRSTWFVLSATVLVMFVLAMVIAYNTRHLTGHQDANDVVPSSPLQGSDLAQLLVGALGILFVSGEFSTGMIRSTFAAVPKRLPVLWAKLAVFVVVIAVTMTATSVGSFLASQAFIGHYRTAYTLSSPGALRVVLGTGLYLTLIGVIGAMIGWIVRSTPGSLVTFVALMLVLPGLFGNFLQHWGKVVNEYLPTPAGQGLNSSLPDSPHLSTGAGLAVLLAWVAAATLVAVATLRRRDA